MRGGARVAAGYGSYSCFPALPLAFLDGGFSLYEPRVLAVEPHILDLLGFPLAGQTEAVAAIAAREDHRFRCPALSLSFLDGGLSLLPHLLADESSPASPPPLPGNTGRTATVRPIGRRRRYSLIMFC